MTKKKKIHSVSELIDSLGCSPKTKAKFKKSLRQRRLSSQLAVSRAVLEVAEKDFSQMIGWSKKKLARFEYSDFSEMKQKDIALYVKTLFDIKIEK